MTDNNITKVIEKRMSLKIPLLRTLRTVQIFLIRQTHDYTIFRTEESRELNSVVTPVSIRNPKQVTRVVFLASKQKAPETREFASMVKSLYNKINGFRERLAIKEDLEKSILSCELKDNLCRACPRCTLFGAVETQDSKTWERWNIKHRIEYSSAFSLETYENISEQITFNAIEEATQTTGQALNTTENILPLVNFPSIITLNSPTWQELVLVIKNLSRCKSYGAEGRTKGDVVNYITGIVVGDEEIMTSLEYVLELASKNGGDIIADTQSVIADYAKHASFPESVMILTPKELESFIDDIQKIKLEDSFVETAFRNSIDFANEVNARVLPQKKTR